MATVCEFLKIPREGTSLHAKRQDYALDRASLICSRIGWPFVRSFVPTFLRSYVRMFVWTLTSDSWLHLANRNSSFSRYEKSLYSPNAHGEPSFSVRFFSPPFFPFFLLFFRSFFLFVFFFFWNFQTLPSRSRVMYHHVSFYDFILRNRRKNYFVGKTKERKRKYSPRISNKLSK